MSGPEALLALSLIEPTISSLRFAKKVHDNANDTKTLPPAFQGVAKHLEVVCEALETAQKQIEQGKDDNICREMKPRVADCNDKATCLQRLFVKVVPWTAAQRVERYREALREIGKGNRVETLIKDIMEDVRLLLTVDDEIRVAAESQLGRLVEAMREVSAIPPALQDESPASGINNFGSGLQNVNTGNGSQHNNSGLGQQFIGSTFHGFNTATGREPNNVPAQASAAER
ncbi:hypothetical protein DL770_010027 [Monosporascus sp. CRB-9-2]|nr:hypothetical protein DL770_010027 [Monosporascus sp. CRB-9-2]